MKIHASNSGRYTVVLVHPAFAWNCFTPPTALHAKKSPACTGLSLIQSSLAPAHPLRPLRPLWILPWGVMMWALWLPARRIINPCLPIMAICIVRRGFMVGRFISFMVATSSLLFLKV
ncbi:hypothetical protein Ppro_0771 [Pelobacter propionicus DSM 2379]|uniref:Uncharacterized protein n=1 Tax=Pelobacter propionicus (strain DSM 2379 / NBRC 103807 / OttBd1) TaxID=338966 RepID=A1AM31_PELPD|nr:hypothetical protein Ppro_0771 [Pelobacter propionicus DSM 2379]